MTVNIELPNFRIVQEKLRKAAMLDKPTSKTMRQITKQGKMIIRTLAPIKSGRLKKSIFRRAYKKKGMIGVFALRRGFRYDFWVNEDLKVATLARRRTAGGRWPNKTLRNSNPPLWTRRWTYRQTKHTGLPGFFTAGAKILARNYPKMMKLNLERHLRVTFQR